jgi:esterase/lipase
VNAADRAMKSAGPGCERGSMRRWHPHAGRVVGAVAAMFVSILLGGCASYQDEPVAAERVASGWRNPAALSPRDDFDAYVAQVTEELRHHRLPFDASRAEAELRAVAPFKITPDQRCETDIPRGIAILIHGLSDTAFAMRDLATTLSKQCFEARALLLPGHGTRPADLMAVGHDEWLSHVDAAVRRARAESPYVVIAGFSLGAAVALTVAAQAPGNVDAVIGLAPAYRIRSEFVARQASWMAAFRPWLDLGPREDFARYGAMPTQGIASTMAVLGTMQERMRQRGQIRTPWLIVQSEDDEVIDVDRNRQFFATHAGDARSLLVNYFSAPREQTEGNRAVWLPAAEPSLRVVGISHLAVHISPENPHYGESGTYRNCGSPPFRTEDEVRTCKQAQRVWYGVGGQSPPAGEAGARATFNPHYRDLERRIGEFLGSVDGQHHSQAATRRGEHNAVPATGFPSKRKDDASREPSLVRELDSSIH